MIPVYLNYQETSPLSCNVSTCVFGHATLIWIFCFIPYWGCGNMVTISWMPFQFNFRKCKLLYFALNFTEICSQQSNQQWSNIGSDNDLVSYRRQAFIGTNDCLVYWSIHMLLGLNVLIHKLLISPVLHWEPNHLLVTNYYDGSFSSNCLLRTWPHFGSQIEFGEKN